MRRSQKQKGLLPFAHFHEIGGGPIWVVGTGDGIGLGWLLDPSKIPEFTAIALKLAERLINVKQQVLGQPPKQSPFDKGAEYSTILRCRNMLPPLNQGDGLANSIATNSGVLARPPRDQETRLGLRGR